MRGPVEGGHAVHLGGVHVGTALQKRPDARPVGLLRGAGERRIGRGRRRPRPEQAKPHGQGNRGRSAPDESGPSPVAGHWRAPPCQMPSGSNNPSTLPLLSANLSRRTPTLSSSVRCRLAGGVAFRKRRCRPPFMPPAAAPATALVRVVWACTFGLPMPLPYRYSEWSSSEPLPSLVALSLPRNSANSETWNWLIFASLAIFAGSLPWCDSGWCGSGTPTSGYVRLLVSRANWNVMTRVTSPCQASTCRSNINRAWSA